VAESCNDAEPAAALFGEMAVSVGVVAGGAPTTRNVAALEMVWSGFVTVISTVAGRVIRLAGIKAVN